MKRRAGVQIPVAKDESRCNICESSTANHSETWVLGDDLKMDVPIHGRLD